MFKKISVFWAMALFAFIAVLLPLYIPQNGYSYMGNDKYIFFLYGMTAFVINGVLCFGYAAYKRILPKLSKTDWFVIAFGICTLLSYLFSAHKNVALFGNDEWNLGLISQLLFIFIYFGISRFLEHLKGCIYVVCLIGIPMALLAIVNRFGWYPLPIEGQHPLYISTIGNINWFCGYFIMLTAMELVLYFSASKKHDKILFGTTLFISLSAIICQGSMSGYVTLLFLLLLLLKPALQSKQAFLAYLEIYLFLFSGCTLTYVTGYFIPGAYVEYDTIVNLVAFSILPCFCLFCVAALYIAVYFGTQKIELTFLYKYVIGVVITVFIGYLGLCTVNTFMPQVTPFLNDNSLYTFDRFWWSTRGGTYAIGVQAFLSLPWYRMIFGIGPDCFLTYVYDNLDKVTVAKHFVIQPLANAHNELLTMLVNTGMAGLVAYAGIFITGIKNAYKSTNPFMKVLLFGILGYIVNNFFSFQQIISTPFVFVLLGMAESLVRKEQLHATN